VATAAAHGGSRRSLVRTSGKRVEWSVAGVDCCVGSGIDARIDWLIAWIFGRGPRDAWWKPRRISVAGEAAEAREAGEAAEAREAAEAGEAR
jgi:hypothetical protein